MTTIDSAAAARRRLLRLRFRDLQLLVELGRGGSLRSVASNFAVTQPALSRTLAEIEAAFGLPLFARSARGVEPTPEGRLVIRSAGALIEDLGHLRDEAEQGLRSRASIRLGVAPFIAQHLMPPLVARLAKLDPPVRVQLSEMGSPALIEALVAGHLDAVVGTSLRMMVTPERQVGLRCEPLFVGELAVIVAGSHPFARRTKVPWRDLSAQPWVFPFRGTRLYRVLEECFVHSGIAMPLPLVEVSSPVTAIRMAGEGVGFALVPALALTAVRSEGDVRKVRVAPSIRGEEVALISRISADTARLDIVREHLQAVTRRLV